MKDILERTSIIIRLMDSDLRLNVASLRTYCTQTYKLIAELGDYYFSAKLANLNFQLNSNKMCQVDVLSNNVSFT